MPQHAAAARAAHEPTAPEAVPTGRSPRRRPRLVVAALLACVLALVAGCKSSDVVAYLDGESVLTATQLEQAAEAMLPYVQSDQGLRQVIIGAVVTGEAGSRLAETHDIELTGEQQQLAADAPASQLPGLEDPQAVEILTRYFEALLIQQALEQEQPGAWAAGLQAMDVELNPRYGAGAFGVSGQQQSFEYQVFGASGSLSEPATDPNQPG